MTVNMRKKEENYYDKENWGITRMKKLSEFSTKNNGFVIAIQNYNFMLYLAIYTLNQLIKFKFD